MPFGSVSSLLFCANKSRADSADGIQESTKACRRRILRETCAGTWSTTGGSGGPREARMRRCVGVCGVYMVRDTGPYWMNKNNIILSTVFFCVLAVTVARHMSAASAKSRRRADAWYPAGKCFVFCCGTLKKNVFVIRLFRG